MIDQSVSKSLTGSEAINLTVKQTLLANDEPEGRENHWLKPALKHESSTVATRVSLTIAIPESYGFELTWFKSRGFWIKTSKNGYIEFTAVSDPMRSGDLWRLHELGFKNPKPGTYAITYKIGGEDDKGRKLKVAKTVVRVTFE